VGVAEEATTLTAVQASALTEANTNDEAFAVAKLYWAGDDDYATTTFWYDIVGEQLQIEDRDLILDSTETNVFSLTGADATLKSTTFTGGVVATTGTTTVRGATALSGGNFDCDISYDSDSTTITDVTCTGALDFTTTGTYNLNGCTINEVTNSSGGTVTLVLDNSSITTVTGPNVEVNDTRSVSITGIVAGSRLQVYNVTTASEVANEVVSGTSYSATYNEGADYTEGDTVRVRLAYQSGVTAKSDFETNAVAGSAGWSVLANQTDDSVYNDFGLDGSTVTEFTFDSGDIHVDINDADNVTQIQRLGAWNYYYITTEDGIRNLLGGIEWETTNSIKVCTDCVDLKIHNTKANALLLKGGRLYRDDSATIIASTSNSIQMDYSPVYTTAGSGGGDATLANQTQILSDIADIEAKVDAVDTVVDAILVDTNELQGNQGDWATATTTIASNMRGTDGANTVAPATPTNVTDVQTAIQTDIGNLNNISEAQVKSQADQAITDANLDTKSNVKPSISV